MRALTNLTAMLVTCSTSRSLRWLKNAVALVATRLNRVGRVIQLCCGLTLLLGAIQIAPAYSPPPSWDPMLMLNVTLNANNQLAVQTNPYAVTLIVAPGAYDPTNKFYHPAFVTFDPAQPYAVLNGTAYSRVYGWYDQGTTGFNGDNFYDTYTNQLHGTNFIWIEKISGSPELKTYFINEDVTGDPATPYTPIFGTDGSSPKWKWDGKMDHNAYAVDLRCLNASNQLFTATYHLYVGEAAGNTNFAFGQTTTTWRWKGPALPVIPALRIASTNAGVRLSWLNTVSNLALVTATTPTAVVWNALTNSPVTSNGWSQLEMPISPAPQFFRLQLLP
jgi:hypothetical protein